MGRPRKPTHVEVTLTLPRLLVEKSERLLASRQTDLTTYVRLRLRGLVLKTRFFGLRDKLNFGKYNGEVVGAVIAADPQYVAWCLREIDDFGLEPEALNVLAETGVDL